MWRLDGHILVYGQFLGSVLYVSSVLIIFWHKTCLTLSENNLPQKFKQTISEFGFRWPDTVRVICSATSDPDGTLAPGSDYEERSIKHV
jgi:hypothetical protein